MIPLIIFQTNYNFLFLIQLIMWDNIRMKIDSMKNHSSYRSVCHVVRVWVGLLHPKGHMLSPLVGLNSAHQLVQLYLG